MQMITKLCHDLQDATAHKSLVYEATFKHQAQLQTMPQRSLLRAGGQHIWSCDSPIAQVCGAVNMEQDGTHLHPHTTPAQALWLGELAIQHHLAAA